MIVSFLQNYQHKVLKMFKLPKSACKIQTAPFNFSKIQTRHIHLDIKIRQPAAPKKQFFPLQLIKSYIYFFKWHKKTNTRLYSMGSKLAKQRIRTQRERKDHCCLETSICKNTYPIKRQMGKSSLKRSRRHPHCSCVELSF